MPYIRHNLRKLHHNADPKDIVREYNKLVDFVLKNRIAQGTNILLKQSPFGTTISANVPPQQTTPESDSDDLVFP